MKKQIIKTSSYTASFPHNWSETIKVAVKVKNWNKNECIETEVFENAIYDQGFVSVDGGKSFYLAGNFLFHKLKR